jgi:hypothetical protein
VGRERTRLGSGVGAYASHSVAAIA